MAVSFLDRCIFTPTSGGTGDWTVSAAVTGYQTPANAGAANGATYHYAAQSTDGSQWEYGLGTYNTTGPVLARTSVLGNSINDTTKISFTTAPNVIITILAEAGLALLSAANVFTALQSIPAFKSVQTDKGSIGTGTVTFDVSVASKQKLTVTGSLAIAFSNWPSSGTYGEVEIQLVNGGAGTVTWPTTSWLVGDGTTSTTFSSMGVTLSASGTNTVIVWSTDGGTTLYGKAG